MSATKELGKDEEAVVDNMMVVSFYTPEPYYKNCGELLKQDCERLGLDYNIVAIPGHGNWLDNINIKPAFINECMTKHDRPLLWVDGDSRILLRPDYFLNKYDCDISMVPTAPVRQRAWRVGIIYVNNTDVTKRFLQRWSTLMENDKGNGICTDEYYLDRTWREMGHTMEVTTTPGSYAHIGRPLPGTVIEYGLSGNVGPIVKRREEKTVAAYWGDQNLGDYLTPFMILRETEQWPEVGGLNSLVCSGSTLKWCKPGATVWGAGVFRMNEVIQPELNILATRGPLSAWVAENNGYKKPNVYGDPGLLLPYFYNEKTEFGKYELGIVPHYVDYEYVKTLFEEREDVPVINPITENVWTTVDEIRQCKRIASSSLHGLVVAAAYEIPNAWIAFPNQDGRQIEGDGTKFKDFYMSINQDVPDSQMVKCVDDVAHLKYVDAGDVLPLFDDLWDCCPFRTDNL